MTSLTLQLAKRLQREAAIVQLKMGNLEIGICDHPFPPQQDVQIDRARFPFRCRFTAELDLDLFQDSEQLLWRKIALDLHDRIEKSRLMLRAYRSALVQRRASDHRRAINSAEGLDRPVQLLLSIPQIGTKSDVDFFAHLRI